MRTKSIPAFLWLVSVLALVAGGGLVALAAWTRPLAEAEQAAEAGDLQRALELYADGESRFDRFSFTKQLLPDAYQASIANQLWIQYRLEQYDELLEKASSGPSIPDAHFWAGAALFAKAAAEEQPDGRMGWLNRSSEEFRKSLELAPQDWNTKYNYELAERILAEMRKQPKSPPKQMMQLLRPQNKAGDRPTRRIG